MTDVPPDLSAMPFEDALKRLEDIVTQLESGQAPLESSIEMYETGNRLRAHCDALLKSAEARIEKITLSSSGAPKGVEPLDVDEPKP